MHRTHFFFIAKSALAISCVLLFESRASEAGLIHSYSHIYAGGDVEIDLNVFDDQPGGGYLWEYTVTNNGFDPNPGTSNGFSGFELFLPSPIPEIADITPNPTSTPPWDIDCCSGSSTEWDIPNSDGNGIMPGNIGVFSFTTAPRQVAINDSGWFHTWQNDAQTDIIDTLGMHVPWVPGLVPIPEPGTFALAGIGLVLARRRRRG
jgi:MYXO-CTERM domain-containing protein